MLHLWSIAYCCASSSISSALSSRYSRKLVMVHPSWLNNFEFRRAYRRKFQGFCVQFFLTLVKFLLLLRSHSIGTLRITPQSRGGLGRIGRYERLARLGKCAQQTARRDLYRNHAPRFRWHWFGSSSHWPSSYIRAEWRSGHGERNPFRGLPAVRSRNNGQGVWRECHPIDASFGFGPVRCPRTDCQGRACFASRLNPQGSNPYMLKFFLTIWAGLLAVWLAASATLVVAGAVVLFVQGVISVLS